MVDLALAEISVAGSILIDADCLPDIRRVLPDESVFASNRCGAIYAAACRLADEEKPVDPVSVLGLCPEVDRNFAVQAMSATPTACHAAFYAQQVLDGYRRRKAAAVGQALSREDNPVDELIMRADADLQAMLPKGDAAADFSDLNALLQFREDLEAGRRCVLQTGLPSVDSLLGGLQPGGLYLIAARPSIGKSAFGIALADMLAKRKRVLFLSLEMTGVEIAARRAAAFSKCIPGYQALLTRAHLSDEQNSDLCAVSSALASRSLFVRQEPGLTVGRAGVLARQTGAEVLFIDYLGLMSDPGKTEYERVTAISGGLKRLAQTLRIVVIALCQLNRETEAQKEGRPMLYQLRSSGALEQDADAVLLLHRPEKGSGNPAEPFEISVAKNRHGKTGKALLTFYPAVNRFEDTSQRGGRQYQAKSWAM